MTRATLNQIKWAVIIIILLFRKIPTRSKLWDSCTI